MTPQSARWGKVLLPLVAHNAIKVRERVLAVLEMTLDMLLANQKDLTASVVPTFKSVSNGWLDDPGFTVLSIILMDEKTRNTCN